MEQVSLEEASRLAALEGHKVLDRLSEAGFERIAEATALMLDAPMAVVGFLDGSRHWFKAAFGVNEREDSRAELLCTHAIEQAGVFEVTDTPLDPHLAELPIVTEAAIRARAGAPLVTSGGERIGTLCVFDTQLRFPLEPIEQTLLLELAGLAMRLLELRLEGSSAAELSITEVQSLDWRALYGRGDNAPLPAVTSSAASNDSTLLERVRSVAPAPMVGGAARLPRGRVLVTHTFGTAPDGAIWRIWGLGKTSAPRALESFTGDMTALKLPDDTALLLLSLEGLADEVSAPTRVLASGQVSSNTPVL